MKKTVIFCMAAAMTAAISSPVSAEYVSPAEAYRNDALRPKFEEELRIAFLGTDELIGTFDFIREYYAAITADMSWYTDKTEYFSLIDVTGDDYPELIVTEDGGYYNSDNDYLKKTVRRFYSLKNGKAEHIYSLPVSREYLTRGTDEKGRVCWLYSDLTESAAPDGNYTMKREYGLLYFGEDNVRKNALYSASETVDPKADTMTYSYKGGKIKYGGKTVRGYSKKKDAADREAKEKYKKWYNAAGTWEYTYFNNVFSPRMSVIPARYDSDLIGYGLYYTPLPIRDNELSDKQSVYLLDEYTSLHESYHENVTYRKEKDSPLLMLNIAELCDAYVRDSYELKLKYSYKKYRPAGIDEEDDVPAGKPVIYLYPEKETDVSVKLELKGEFTLTYPEYGNGWNVKAYPDGKIETSDGNEYSYLFWEGDIRENWDVSKGFVVRGCDTEEFLREKLSLMGLTPKEYNEFIVWWLPRLKDNPYNLITFQTEAYESAAKLIITPKPDSLLRIFMLYKPLDKYMEIPEQALKPFEREGFTVVEWGGAEFNIN